MAQLSGLSGTEYDRTFAQLLRQAHGKVFGVVAGVRAGTRNEMIRLYAERANTMVSKHMALLESTGLVQYDHLPHAAIGAPAVTLANATAPLPKDPNPLRPPVVAFAIVVGLLGLVSIRRVVQAGG